MQDRYFAGHVCFGVHRHLPQPFTYVTLLRDPVARIISLYHYSCQNPTAYYHKLAVGKSLKTFALGTSLMELDNGQVRFLSGDDSDYFINRTPISYCDGTLLKTAQDNIDKHFSLVGLTEYFDQSVLLLSHLMGWNHSYYLRRNSTSEKKKALVSESLRAEIADRNWLDIKLYNYAKQRFLQQLDHHGLDDISQVERFQQKNALFNQYLGLPYTVYDATKAMLRKQVGRPS